MIKILFIFSFFYLKARFLFTWCIFIRRKNYNTSPGCADKIVILGSGGGRHHIRTQYRATGGILFHFNNIQAHIDPGPGAIVRVNQFNEDPTKTELFISTHFHLDHFNDLCTMIEASREKLHDKNYVYKKKGTLITTQEVLNFIPQYHLNMLEKIIPFTSNSRIKYNGVEIVGTKIEHSHTNGFGVRFNLSEYSIAFSSDTTVFDGFEENFHGVDILFLNLLRPNDIICKRHMNTDQVIPYLNKINPQPKALIINHFGAYMDSPLSKKNYVPSQVIKIKRETQIRSVIAGEDGLNIKISELLNKV